MSDQSGTANLKWFTVEGEGDKWYVIDRRDNSRICGAKAASIAYCLARDLNDGWPFLQALMRVAGVTQTRVMQ